MSTDCYAEAEEALGRAREAWFRLPDDFSGFPHALSFAGRAEPPAWVAAELRRAVWMVWPPSSSWDSRHLKLLRREKRQASALDLLGHPEGMSCRIADDEIVEICRYEADARVTTSVVGRLPRGTDELSRPGSSSARGAPTDTARCASSYAAYGTSPIPCSCPDAAS